MEVAKGRKQQPCLTPNCDRKSEVRGVCRRCYEDYYRRIRAGEKLESGETLTWEWLIGRGLVKAKHDPADSRRPSTVAIAPLLGSSEPTSNQTTNSK